MQEVRRQLDYFDISQICDSGQCFRMSRLEDDSYAVIEKERACLTESQRRTPKIIWNRRKGGRLYLPLRSANLEAFPVDAHIRQALEEHYPKGFPKRRYQGFQGIMQQYIFYHELMGNR